jgi:hypothetical protein
MHTMSVSTDRDYATADEAPVALRELAARWG